MSRRSMWLACRELAGRLPDWPAISAHLAADTYGLVKQGLYKMSIKDMADIKSHSGGEETLKDASRNANVNTREELKCDSIESKLQSIWWLFLSYIVRMTDSLTDDTWA